MPRSIAARPARPARQLNLKASPPRRALSRSGEEACAAEPILRRGGAAAYAGGRRRACRFDCPAATSVLVPGPGGAVQALSGGYDAERRFAEP